MTKLTHAYIHTTQYRAPGVAPAEGCGGPAFLLTNKPPRFSVLRSSDVRRLDGSTVAYASTIRCGACGAALVGTPQHAAIVELPAPLGSDALARDPLPKSWRPE